LQIAFKSRRSRIGLLATELLKSRHTEKKVMWNLALFSIAGLAAITVPRVDLFLSTTISEPQALAAVGGVLYLLAIVARRETSRRRQAQTQSKLQTSPASPRSARELAVVMPSR
jgi:hypothetical protein